MKKYDYLIVEYILNRKESKSFYKIFPEYKNLQEIFIDFNNAAKLDNYIELYDKICDFFEAINTDYHQGIRIILN